MKKLLITAVLLLPLLLTGCFLIERNTAILWTNIPEIAAYVEIFNASQDDYRIELVYEEQPTDYNKLTSDSSPDIVIAEDLASNSIISAFEPLNKLIENQFFDPSILYPSLYKTGCRDDIPYVLPVSFNIPAIMYKHDTLSDGHDSLVLGPEDLKTEAELFNSLSTEKFRVKGFSPLWSPEFLLYNAFISGSSFSEALDGSLLWNEKQLEASTDFCRNWIEDINGGYEEEEDFTLTYCYDPGYKLLNAGRIGFYFTTLREFYSIPADDRASLDYKWLGSKTAIPVCEDIVYIGIPGNSDKKKTARQFTTWFVNADTQKHLLESSQFKRTRGFGICNGLSSVYSLNELVMPRYYKFLIGKIPPAEYIDVPKPLPPYWSELRSDVIIPWLQTQTSKGPGTEPLADILKTWKLQEQKK